jgi:hypothetical protein
MQCGSFCRHVQCCGMVQCTRLQEFRWHAATYAVNAYSVQLVNCNGPAVTFVARLSCHRLFNVVQVRWPGAQVHLFGSTATRLNLRSSNDLDISLDLPSAVDKVSTAAAVVGSCHTHTYSSIQTFCTVCSVKRLPYGTAMHASLPAPMTPFKIASEQRVCSPRVASAQAAVVAEVAQLMEAAGMQELLCLTKARIPVVKFEYRHPFGEIKVLCSDLFGAASTSLLSRNDAAHMPSQPVRCMYDIGITIGHAALPLRADCTGRHHRQQPFGSDEHQTAGRLCCY